MRVTAGRVFTTLESSIGPFSSAFIDVFSDVFFAVRDRAVDAARSAMSTANWLLPDLTPPNINVFKPIHRCVSCAARQPIGLSPILISVQGYFYHPVEQSPQEYRRPDSQQANVSLTQ